MATRGSDTIEQVRSQLQDRLRELDDERAQVEKALAALGGRRGPGRPRGSRNRPAGGRRRRGRRGGTRRDQAVKMVEAEPGISAGQIAKNMDIAPNYMYRVMGELEKEGRVRKEGRGYHPAS
jgi:predicted Rossmann fold nucleotide-binding protein DprA/Smf involved in DNA uptake